MRLHVSLKGAKDYLAKPARGINRAGARCQRYLSARTVQRQTPQHLSRPVPGGGTYFLDFAFLRAGRLGLAALEPDAAVGGAAVLALNGGRGAVFSWITCRIRSSFLSRLFGFSSIQSLLPQLMASESKEQLERMPLE